MAPGLRRLGWWLVLSVGPVMLALAWIIVAAGFARGGLMRVVTWYLGPLVVPVAGVLALPVSALVAWRDPQRRPLAIVTAIVALVSLLPTAMLLGLWTPRYPGRIEDVSPTATVRLPLDGPLVVAWGGDTVATNYHAASPDQRWAYDLLVEPAGHGSADLASYGCYGLDVVAPTAASVALVHDGEPDQDPSGFVPNYEAPAGNHVVLELETGTYLLLAHLIPGSPTVSAGDIVAEGQPLGRCGNSGNTSEPHVHIHHVRQFPEQIGFGEGLPLYFRDHGGKPMPTGGVEVDGDRPIFLGDRVRHQR